MQPPKHVAIIMDGNGRWAQLRSRPRTFGHLKGARVAKKIITACVERGVEYLTLFAFSTENWARPSEEVSFLMRLLSRYLKKEIKTLMKQDVRFLHIGNLLRLPPEAREMVLETEKATAKNRTMTLVFALSYGGRQEITQAVKKLGSDLLEGRLASENIDEQLISSYLSTSFMPDPDLIIRTSGEYRISNFLLWQMAYSELFFTEKNWPDFSTNDLDEIFELLSKRERRFGRIGDKPQATRNLSR